MHVTQNNKTQESTHTYHKECHVAGSQRKCNLNDGIIEDKPYPKYCDKRKQQP